MDNLILLSDNVSIIYIKMNDILKILVVEDEGFIMKLLIKRLAEFDFEVLKAIDGKEGLDIALKEHPDLILLDIVMPRMDGIEMAKRLRKDEWGKDVPIIFLTNLCSKVHEAESLGIHEYIIKSNTNIDELCYVIRQKLSLPLPV